MLVGIILHLGGISITNRRRCASGDWPIPRVSARVSSDGGHASGAVAGLDPI